MRPLTSQNSADEAPIAVSLDREQFEGLGDADQIAELLPTCAKDAIRSC